MKRETQTDKLQRYLDQQIEAFSQPSKPSFDHIETKLKKIEEKLLGLKSQSQQQIKYNYGQQTSQKNLVCSSIRQSEKEWSPVKNQPVFYQKEVRDVEVYTPAKHLDIVPKTMSATHLGGTYGKGSAQKSKKKCHSTAKKKNLQVQSLSNLLQAKKPRLKSTPQKATVRRFNQTIVNDSQRQVKVLKKQIQQQQKTNADLRRRMNELKSYEVECHKLKQIFDRCEQLRRHTRLNKHKF